MELVLMFMGMMGFPTLMGMYSRVEEAAMRAEWWRGFELAGRVLAAGGLEAAPAHLLPPALTALHRDGDLRGACEEAARVVRATPPPSRLIAHDGRAWHARSLVKARRVPTQADAYVLIGFAEGLVAAEV